MNQILFDIPKEVESYLEDSRVLGAVNDGDNWYVTAEWADTFRTHLNIILPLAKLGGAVAQYHVAAIYLCGCLYSSEKDAERAYEVDIVEMSKWLEYSAKAGYIAAIDSLITTGVGDEAERLKAIYIKHKGSLENAAPPSDGWLRDMEMLYNIAYETS